MATNYVQKGDRLNLAVTEGKKSGDWDMVGDLPVVLLTDADADNTADCALEGVFDLTVTGENASSGAAVTQGMTLYADSDLLNLDADNGKDFGYALAPVDSGASAVIPVKLKG